MTYSAKEEWLTYSIKKLNNCELLGVDYTPTASTIQKGFNFLQIVSNIPEIIKVNPIIYTAGGGNIVIDFVKNYRLLTAIIQDSSEDILLVTKNYMYCSIYHEALEDPRLLSFIRSQIVTDTFH